MRKHNETALREHEPREEREVTVSRTPGASLETIPTMTRIEREMLTTLHEMERWFEDTLHRPFFGFHRLPLTTFRGEQKSTDFVPALDMFEEGNELIIRAELAGVKREDIKLELSGNRLVLSGEKTGGETVERKGYYRVEQCYGSFSRSIELPEGVNLEDVKASHKDGVLEIRIPKIAETGNIRNVPIS
ncbi:Hsp20/alpha crystallin family protein [Pelotalea chapellei]|uniref:Hsp20/alpha crystallin family protein n=1 Tax=Pelotalea chapellei TaxID=44671 RepID=A0ABS5U917_9BACT|nr:Hsp20/alpha crystallin family protein [Pelotalea chapellei]MBT1072164.1 Hsp20/alpha crystallin family protein [Pelotalea chapellei]